jgi:hypothetical protein
VLRPQNAFNTLCGCKLNPNCSGRTTAISVGTSYSLREWHAGINGYRVGVSLVQALGALEMKKNLLAPNVEAYEPETDPAAVDLDELLARGWPPELVECVGRQRYGSAILHEFEMRRSNKG